MVQTNQITNRGRRCWLGALALTALLAAPAAAQVSVGVSVGQGYGHRRDAFVRGAHQPVFLHGNRPGTIHPDQHIFRRPGSVGFFSYHDYQPRQYRTYHSPRTVIVSDPCPTVISPGVSVFSYSSRSSRGFIGTSSVVSSRSVHSFHQPVIRETVIVPQVVPQVVERTVFIERENPERFGRESYREPSRGGLISQAESAHRAGDWHSAIRLYEQAISYREDVGEARRGLAIVYLETDQVSEAIRQIERAYEDEPALAYRVFNDRILEGSRLGYAIELAQRTADRQGTSRAWLMVGVLRQAAGDRDGAQAAIREASRLGLHHRVVNGFYSALTR